MASNKKQIPVHSIRPEFKKLLSKMKPDFDKCESVSEDELNAARMQYFENLLVSEKGELNELERSVAKALGGREYISRPSEIMGKPTFGQKLADKIARFGGSWTFIVGFTSALVLWVAWNAIEGQKEAIDPFPFILLNLILSCLAALQAPIIMMSQNRQAEKDRRQAENDYKVNLKSEIEIRVLHEKLDRALAVEWERLENIEKLQKELAASLRKDS